MNYARLNSVGLTEDSTSVVSSESSSKGGQGVPGALDTGSLTELQDYIDDMYQLTCNTDSTTLGEAAASLDVMETGLLSNDMNPFIARRATEGAASHQGEPETTADPEEAELDNEITRLHLENNLLAQQARKDEKRRKIAEMRKINDSLKQLHLNSSEDSSSVPQKEKPHTATPGDPLLQVSLKDLRRFEGLQQQADVQLHQWLHTEEVPLLDYSQL